MLPKNKRLSRKLFDHTFTKGRVLHSPIFTLRYAPCAEKDPKVSFVVSKKVGKTAVLRNKLRRLGYSIVVKNEEKFLPGVSYIFFFKKEAKELLSPELEKVILELVSKIKK